MIDDLTITEQQVADIKAAEYLGKGYRVRRDVPLEFLPGYRADLVAEKDGEVKVIEIKARSSLRAIPVLREFERVIESRPGWSFELQIVGEPEKIPVPEPARWLDEAGTRTRLTQANRLVQEGLYEAALLIAWTAAEAATRALVAEAGVAIERATNPAYILGTAVAHGAISREDYRILVRLMAFRNAVAHGFEASDLNSTSVNDLIAVVERLLQEIGDGYALSDTPG